MKKDHDIPTIDLSLKPNPDENETRYKLQTKLVIKQSYMQRLKIKNGA